MREKAAFSWRECRLGRVGTTGKCADDIAIGGAARIGKGQGGQRVVSDR